MSGLLEPPDPGGRSGALAPRAGRRAARAAPPGPAPAAAPALLAFDRASKWYGPVIGVNEVTLELGPGITGLVGPNGAGKSTLMKLATGQLRPDLGGVTLRGVPAHRAAAMWHLGYCAEADAFYEEMSGRQFVTAMARLFGFGRGEAERRTAAVLERVGMADRADRKLRGYSKGMRQRVKLAQALVHDPELLILDEPLNGIDPLGRLEMSRLFRELADQGKSLLISSHQLEELERLTDRVLVMARGRLVAQGTVAQIRNLFEDQPFSIRIDCDRPRELAAALLRLPDVLGVELGSERTVVARARNPQRFFRALGGLVLGDGFDVGRLETLDVSAQAILDYVLKGG
jgi:ABC-2 type transport system ATP-binding protein